ncbi:MAG: c-type cytochrome [Acidobacteriaceae bacterium]|nr:c-type cytochrome [Acidobacteriaceae bacterium]
MRARVALFAFCCSFGLVIGGCEPPGKPRPEEAQAENRETILDHKVLFNSNCAGCHGLNGKYGPARIINDAIYLSIIPRDTFRNTVANGRPGTAMPAWAKSQGGPLTGRQIDSLVDGIYKDWGNNPGDVPQDAPPYSANGKAGDPNHGKQLFARDCFMCHGKGAAVGPITEPVYLQLVSNQMLRSSIITGRRDLGMPDYRDLNMGKALSDQDVTDLVAYLNSLRTTPAPGETGAAGGEQAGSTGPHENENGPGQGQITKGNEGGNGPGSPQHQENEGSKGKGSSSQ